MDNVYLSADEYIEYTCEQADKIMQMKLGKSYTTYVKNIGKETTYTEEGQDIFNDILGYVENLLADIGIYNEENKNG